MLKIILTVLLLLPTPPGVSKAQRSAWLHQVAPTIVQASQGDPVTAAYLVSIGEFESHFAQRIQAGHCRGRECDHGSAHGIWQMHSEALAPHWKPEDVIGADPTHLQAAADAAAHRIRQVRKMCGERPAAVFGGYQRSCDHMPPKLQARLRLYRWVLRKLQ